MADETITKLDEDQHFGMVAATIMAGMMNSSHFAESVMVGTVGLPGSWVYDNEKIAYQWSDLKRMLKGAAKAAR